MIKKIFTWGLPGLVLLLLLIQLVPYGRDHINPPVSQEPPWDSPQTRELAMAACQDCHSNETIWPWYSNVAPVSWLVQHDVIDGRQRLNFSQWDRSRGQETDDIAQVVQKGEMPPWYFLMLHPEARLSQADEQLLIQGLEATFGK